MTRQAVQRERLPKMDLRGLAQALARFGAASAERGRRYARDGHVERLDVDRSGDGFAARVRGTHAYRCEWMAGSSWTNACTCPLTGQCKHAYAAACVLLAHELPGAGYRRVGPATIAAPELGRIPKARLRVVDLVFDIDEDDDSMDGDLDDEFDEDFEEEFDEDSDDEDEPVAAARAVRLPPRRAARPRPRRATDSDLPRLAGLFDTLHSSTRRDLRDSLIRRIAAAVNVPAAAVNPWELAQEQDGDLCCGLLASGLADLARAPLPAAIDAWRNAPAVADKLRRRREHSLREEMERWTQPVAASSPKHLRVAVRAKVSTSGLLSFDLAPLLTSAKLRDDLRRPEQLRALLDEAQRVRGLLSPPSHFLLDWLCTHYLSAPWWTRSGIRLADLERLLIAFGHTGLITWQSESNAELLARAGIRDGDPVRLSSESASIEPACNVENGSAKLELRVQLGKGGTCPLDDVVHLPSAAGAEPSYLLAAGMLWRLQEEPPARVLEGFRALGTLTLDPADRVSFLRRLASRYPAVAATLVEHTAQVPARAVFLLDGDEHDGLRVRLLAVDRDAHWEPGTESDPRTAATVRNSSASANNPGAPSGPRFEYTREAGWQRENDFRAPMAADKRWEMVAPAPGDSVDDRASQAIAIRAPSESGVVPISIADAWLVEPDRAAAEPAVSWLRSLCSEPGEDAAVWSAPLRPPRFEALASAWAQRPRDAAFFATRRIKRLLGEGLRPVPRLDIRSSGKDWFAVKLEWQVEGESLSQADVAALLSSNSEFVRLGDGWVRAASREGVREAIVALADAGIDVCEEEQRLGLWQLATAPAHTLASLEKLGADPATVAAAAVLRRKVAEFRGLPRVAVPRTFRGELRSYQHDGLDFLAFMSSLGSGAVLADDMGLGKTVQTLAWLERLRLAGNTGGPALVVCPASVVHNWREEAARFAPRMRVAVMASGRERHELRESAGDFDLLITNYALLRLDVAHWSGIKLGTLVLDEAQNVKNPDAAVSRVVRSLDARRRLALTGTPLENRTRDLWSIVESVSPGYFGTRKKFEARFEGPDVTDADRRLLAARLRPVMLRRRKGDVATDLPPRTEETRRFELGTEQRRLYLATLRASRRLVDGLESKGQQAEKARIQILAALTKLRQICCHPGLVDARLASAGSAKFDLLMEVLEPLLAEGHKVLVFSQFARCIQLLAGELRRRELRHFILTGATQKRDRVVAAFQTCEEPAVFLVSLKAGGTGLNLTAASYVVLFDPWWNPAVEAQAIDRTHRIGQTRSVMAYRLVASDTIEEKILELQLQKAMLADAVFDDATFGRRLGKEDLAFLLEA